MAEFEILDEGEGLVHGDVAVGFEEHHCCGETRGHVTYDQLYIPLVSPIVRSRAAGTYR